jgi:hypothetical protein
VLTARTPAERAAAVAELGPAARVVAPEAASAGGDVDFLFAASVPMARPLLTRLADGGAVVLTSPAPTAEAVRALAAELLPRGIRVNAVAPSCIAAQGGSTTLPPLGRPGAVEEVARAALFLATDATFTTGVRLPVDGGLGRD